MVVVHEIWDGAAWSTKVAGVEAPVINGVQVQRWTGVDAPGAAMREAVVSALR